MFTYSAGNPKAPCLLLAHGAGAGEAHPWMQRVGQGLSARGISVVTFDFPYMEQKRRVPDPGPILEEALAAVGREIRTSPPSTLQPSAWFAGGKSMGGRIASQLAARGDLADVSGLVFFGYPLHPPGKPAQRRDRHLPSVQQPMLFLHGTRDPFGTPDEMRDLVGTLPLATLHLIDGGDHSLAAPKRQDPEQASLELALDLASGWMSHIIAG